MNVFTPVKRILLQLLFLLSCYFASRCIFTILNHQNFNELSTGDFFRLCFYALRFDLSAILFLNLPYIILSLLPLWHLRWFQRSLQWLFIIVNSLAFVFELSDWAYYPFTLKRSTSDVLNMVTRKGDFLSLLPHFLVDYWYVPFFLILSIVVMVIVNRKIVKKYVLHAEISFKIVWQSMLLLIILLGLSIIGVRGGLQRIPINNSNALQVADARYVPIVLNTPFSIIHSFTNSRLENLNYYSDTELKNYFDPVKQYPGKEFRKKNVVVIILESFSKQFTSLGTRKSYTPFLDELMKRSYVCTNAYANALHSAEGIPAVIAGVPSLMDEPLTTSVYGTNKITALPRLLKQKGYTTAFYHGGTNGTMSFDVFSANAGFDKYYGRTEYNNDNDYDGNWGIWDEPFLQYFANGLSKTKQPFFATVFTLSSHEPFKVPEKYRNTLPKGPLPIHQAVTYTDLALRKFFDRVSKEEWFNNTLFVITPDHCSLLSENKRNNWNLGLYEIPVIFYAPGDTAMHGTNDKIVQQIDILPSVLDYLGYDKPFFAFGNSIFREHSPQFAIVELDNSYKWLMNGYMLKTNGLSVTDVYNIKTDYLCTNNICGKIEDTVSPVIVPYFKAYVQLYRSALINDKMVVDTK
jgi:phosphoglycerol transferase MdoB-like AlkP superfamily enzyme